MTANPILTLEGVALAPSEVARLAAGEVEIAARWANPLPGIQCSGGDQGAFACGCLLLKCLLLKHLLVEVGLHLVLELLLVLVTDDLTTLLAAAGAGAAPKHDDLTT